MAQNGSAAFEICDCGRRGDVFATPRGTRLTNQRTVFFEAEGDPFELEAAPAPEALERELEPRTCEIVALDPAAPHPLVRLTACRPATAASWERSYRRSRPLQWLVRRAHPRSRVGP